MADLTNTAVAAAQEGTSFWRRFEGESLEGQYPLERYLGMSKAGATFLSQLAGHEEPVLIKIVRSGAVGWERHIGSWRIAKELQHPNLVRVYACGLGNVDGLRVAYAVTEYPDERLTSVLMDRCLTVDEGRELLQNCAEALAYLHQKGLVHTHVQPADVVAVNEVIKLSSDHILKAGEPDGLGRSEDPYVAPEVVKAGYTPAGDIWSLGATLLQSMAGRLPETGHEDAPPDADMPYSEIVRHCLEKEPANRWTARQVLTALKKPVVQTQVPKKAESANPRVSMPVAEPAGRRRIGAGWYAIPAVCLLIAAFAFWPHGGGRRSGTPSAKAVVAQQQPLKQAGESDRARVTAASLPPQAAEVPVRRSGVASAAPKSSENASRTWSVVVYSYSHAASAQQKAAEINRKYPRLQARAIPAEGGALYLVVLGSAKDPSSGMRLRTEARRLGLPRDSYVRSF